MALDWLSGIIMNVASSAGWDGIKGLFGARGDQEVLSLGLEQPASPIQPPGSRRQEADLATLERIKNLLPSTETIQYLRDHSFGFAHRGEFLEPLDRFLEQTGGPEHQFLSPALERLRQEFRTDVATFQALAGKYTFRHIQPDMYEVPGEWERNGSGLYWKAVGELNATAREVVCKYDVLVQTARRELLR
jgi:hypothetical protein